MQRHQPKTVEEALPLAEDYATVEGEGEAPKRDCPGARHLGPGKEHPVRCDRVRIIRMLDENHEPGTPEN